MAGEISFTPRCFLSGRVPLAAHCQLFQAFFHTNTVTKSTQQPAPTVSSCCTPLGARRGFAAGGGWGRPWRRRGRGEGGVGLSSAEPGAWDVPAHQIGERGMKPAFLRPPHGLFSPKRRKNFKITLGTPACSLISGLLSLLGTHPDFSVPDTLPWRGRLTLPANHPSPGAGALRKAKPPCLL